MITGTYRIAEQNIEICSLYSEIHQLCSAYHCDDEPGFSVFIDAEDILFEREKSAREDLAEGRPVSAFSDAYLETLAVYRKIAEVMPVYQTFLFHGSCIAVDGAVTYYDMKEVKPLLNAMRTISNNINQIARKANETNCIYEKDIILAIGLTYAVYVRVDGAKGILDPAAYVGGIKPGAVDVVGGEHREGVISVLGTTCTGEKRKAESRDDECADFHMLLSSES